MEKCCMSPGRSAKRRSTIWTSLSLTRLRTSPTDSVTLWPPCRRGIVGDASNGALPSRCRRVSPRLTGNRLEPSDLAGGLPLEPVDDADVDGGAGDPHVRQLLLERAPDRIRVTGCPDHQGLGTGRVCRTWYSTIARSSQRCRPGPRQQPTPIGPASEVP